MAEPIPSEEKLGIPSISSSPPNKEEELKRLKDEVKAESTAKLAEQETELHRDEPGDE
jgi:uncharacterized protein YlxP (DUF503 family)